MTEWLFAGIDAGATKTVCLIGDGSRIVGRGASAGGNPSVVGIDGYRKALADAFESARSSGGIVSRSVARAWVGAAGSERPEIRAALRAAAADVLGTRSVTVSHDGRLVLAAAGLAAGVAVVAGTGSSAYSVSDDGREATAGGWGHLLGDEGSGFDVARRGLAAVARAADGRGPETLLTKRLLGVLTLSTPAELREALYPAPPVAEIARLAPVVLETAADGDAVAREIVVAAGKELVEAALACARALRLDRPHVAAAGGLLSVGSLLLAELERGIAGRLGPLTTPAMEPAAGALQLARDPPARWLRLDADAVSSAESPSTTTTTVVAAASVDSRGGEQQ